MVSDQPFWGDVLRRRGAAVASRRAAGELTAGAFARLLGGALGGLAQLQAKAAALAREMRAAPEGLDAAVAALRCVLQAGAGRA
jgi:hypothetical protein